MSVHAMKKLVGVAALVLLSAVVVAQEKTVPVPQGVKVEGMPAIPQSIADGLARYAQSREANLVAWRPTKRQIVITTTFGDVPQFHLIDGPGRARTQLTYLPRPGISRDAAASFDPANPDSLIFQRSSTGKELASLYRFDVATGGISLVMDAQIRYTAVWARHGHWLAYDSTERDGKDRDLYVIEPADPKTKRRLGDFTGSFSPQDWSPDGSTLLANEYVSNTESYIWRIDVKTGAKQTLTPREEGPHAWFNSRFSADGKQVYAVSDRDGDWRIWRCGVPSGTWTAVSPAGVALEGDGSFEISPDGSRLAMLVNKGPWTDLQVLDLTTLKARSVSGLPKGVISRLKWRPGSREVAFTLLSQKAPSDVYSVDTSLGTVSRWTTSETSFNTEVLPPPEIVEIKSRDGIALTGVLYRPPAKFTGPRPVFVNIHGGPEDRSRVQFLGPSNYLLNELGIALLYPNVRGSAGYGRTFSHLDDGRGRTGVLDDMGAFLDWIAARPYLDKNRVVLSGGSYGGWLALEAGVVYNDRIRGVIAGAGPTNLVTFLEETEPGRLENRRHEYGDERDPQMRDFLLSISPVTRAADMKKPTLLIYAGKDTRVAIGQAQELMAALKTNQAPVWSIELTDINHENFPGTRANYDFILASWSWFLQQFVLADVPPSVSGR
jgi:dipeptidyl aminopeptidase/acylaminoacyl peptidase